MRSTRDNRLDLLLFGPGQGRSGCGVAALWCTTHAGFGHFSPTYRVPSGTSRAKSGRVYSAQTSMTVTRLIAGSAGLNAAGIMPKVHDMWVNCKFGRQAGPLSCHRFSRNDLRGRITKDPTVNGFQIEAKVISLILSRVCMATSG